MAAGKILFVDDNEELRDIFKIFLEREGYEVVAVSDGIEAMEGFDPSIDLVITDLIMPRLDGNDMIVKIRQIQPDTKFLIITGWTNIEVPKGVVALYKPVSKDDLVRAVNRVMGKE